METPIRTKADYQALWDETKKAYKDKEKCAVNTIDKCVYLNTKGKKCAVGRAMSPNNLLYSKTSKYIGLVDDLVTNFNLKSIDDILYPRYKGYSLTFWYRLQIWHDNKAFNRDNKATEKDIKSLIKRIKN